MNKEVTITKIMTAPLYEERDTEALGFYYICHVDAMTVEELNDKSDIAAELAFRDQALQSLQGELDEAVEWLWCSNFSHIDPERAKQLHAFLLKHPTEVEGEGA